METKKRYSMTFVDTLISEIESNDSVPTLSPDFVEDGIIYKIEIYKDEMSEVSFLYLSPGAKISPHEHVDDCEEYILVKDRVTLHCKKGGTHSLENPGDEWMPVISIKSKE